MKRIACILIAILIPLVCSGDGWFYTGAGGGGECSTQTETTILATYDDHSEVLYDEGFQVGQSFRATESATLYSIIVRLENKYGTNPTFIARIGTSANLDTYTGVTDATVVSGDAGTEVELIFTGTRPTISSGTTYYVGISNSGAYATRCDLSIDLNSSYTNGAYIYTGLADMDWNLDKTYNADLYLKYKKCD